MVVDFGFKSQIKHSLLPVLAVSGTLSPMSIERQEVSVLMKERLADVVRFPKDHYREGNFSVLIMGHSRRNAISTPF